MNPLLKKIGNKKGIALIATFLIIAVLLIYASAFISVILSQNISADVFKRRTQAFNIAEAGLDRSINWLRAQPSPPIGNRTDPWGGVQTIGGGSYSVLITDLGTVGGSGNIRRYKLASTGTLGNINRVLVNYAQVDNYARYIWFTDSETYNGTTVWFWSLDHLNGPTHTNAHFNIYGNPQFEGEVRSVDDYIRFYNNGNNINLSQTTNPPYDIPYFQYGVEFGVDPITMPNQALALRSAASNGGLYLTGNSTITLNGDGTMNIVNDAYCNNCTTTCGGHPRRCTTTCNPRPCTNQPLPTNGALFVNNGTLTISGTLNGRLTAGASGDVIIPSSIIYASDPRVNPNSDDVMGIIGEQDVVVSYNAPYNVEIDACIMAMGTSFMMQNWDDPPAKGTLTVYGGIIQEERGPVGTFNSTTGQKVSGYSKNYAYDSRLLGSPPPFMPTTGDYVVLSWEED